MTMKTTVLCDMTPCSLLNLYETLVETEAANSSAKTIPISQTTRRQFRGDSAVWFITNTTLICYCLFPKSLRHIFRTNQLKAKLCAINVWNNYLSTAVSASSLSGEMSCCVRASIRYEASNWYIGTLLLRVRGTIPFSLIPFNWQTKCKCLLKLFSIQISVSDRYVDR